MATPAGNEEPEPQSRPQEQQQAQPQKPLAGAAPGLRQLKPMEVNLSRIVLVGTVLYAVAAVVLLPLHDTLTRNGHGRWPWIAVSGAALGLLGLYYLMRRDKAIARDAAHASAGTADGGSGSGSGSGSDSNSGSSGE